MTAPACPTGCGRTVPLGYLMCGPCWSEVPVHLKRNVTRTWTTYSRLPSSVQGAHRKLAREAYRAARDAAIGAIR